MKTMDRESEIGLLCAPRARGWLHNWADRRRGKAGDEGGTLVETAVTLPILLLIITGIFAFGIALNNYLELTDAVGISARTLAISRGQTTDPCATVVSAFYKAAPTLQDSQSYVLAFVLNGTSYSGTSCSSSSTTTRSSGKPGAGGQRRL